MRTARFGVLIGLVLCGILASATRVAADNWPRFRGPNGTGISADKDIPVQWTANDGILWKSALPGKGHSSPVIWGDRIFVQSASTDARERILLCLDATNGKILWSKPVPGTTAKIINPKGSFASATPATDGERVYAAFWDGKAVTLYAYDFKGELVWSHSMGAFAHQHGAGASPIVLDGKVIFTHDHDSPTATLVALDAKTGKPVWQVQRKGYRACYSAPFLLERPNEPAEMIVTSTAGVTAYDPKDGKEKWQWTFSFTGMPLRTVASPVYGDGMILATSGDGSGARHAAGFRVGGKGDISKTNTAWENQEQRYYPYVPCMLLKGDHMYFINDFGFAACHEIKTGKQVWMERLGGEVTASPVLIDGKVYAANLDGTVFVFPAEPTFKLLARNTLGEPVSASPAVADNRLYIRGSTHLFCIGKPAKK